MSGGRAGSQGTRWIALPPGATPSSLTPAHSSLAGASTAAPAPSPAAPRAGTHPSTGTVGQEQREAVGCPRCSYMSPPPPPGKWAVPSDSSRASPRASPGLRGTSLEPGLLTCRPGPSYSSGLPSVPALELQGITRPKQGERRSSTPTQAAAPPPPKGCSARAGQRVDSRVWPIQQAGSGVSDGESRV